MNPKTMKTISLKNTTIIDLLAIYSVNRAVVENYHLPNYLWNLISEIQRRPMTLHHISQFLGCNVTAAKALVKELLGEGILQRNLETTPHSRDEDRTLTEVTSQVNGSSEQLLAECSSVRGSLDEAMLSVSLEHRAESVVVELV